MMTADRGATLGDSRDATLEDWQAVVRLAATCSDGSRRRADARAGRAAGLLAAHCSCALPWLIEQLAALPADHPSHLADDGRGELEDGLAVVDGSRRNPLRCKASVTLQHGDLHPRNVFAVGDRLRMFDFGDAQWAHALEMLAVPYGYVDPVTTHPWPACCPRMPRSGPTHRPG